MAGRAASGPQVWAHRHAGGVREGERERERAAVAVDCQNGVWVWIGVRG